MKRTPSISRFIAALAGVALVLNQAAAADTALAELQGKFEEALGQCEVGYISKLATLDAGYITALERLKGTLGREDKLDQAGLVLEEIDNLKANNPLMAVPREADRRFRDLRRKRTETIGQYKRAHEMELKDLAGKYTAALDQKKRSLTRGGEIREALAYETEITRVNQLVASKRARLSVARELEGKIVEGDLATIARGAKARGAGDARKMIDGEGKGDPSIKHGGHFASGRWPCTFTVELGDLYQVDRVRLHLYDLDNRIYKYRVSVSDNRREWTTVSDKSEKGDAGWQETKFGPQDVRFIRIEGLHNTINEAFHVLELEAYCPAAKKENRD